MPRRSDAVNDADRDVDHVAGGYVVYGFRDRDDALLWYRTEFWRGMKHGTEVEWDERGAVAHHRVWRRGAPYYDCARCAAHARSWNPDAPLPPATLVPGAPVDTPSGAAVAAGTALVTTEDAGCVPASVGWPRTTPCGCRLPAIDPLSFGPETHELVCDDLGRLRRARPLRTDSLKGAVDLGFHPNGKLAWRRTVVRGRPHGDDVEWRPDGALAVHRVWQRGELRAVCDVCAPSAGRQ